MKQLYDESLVSLNGWEKTQISCKPDMLTEMENTDIFLGLKISEKKGKFSCFSIVNSGLV